MKKRRASTHTFRLSWSAERERETLIFKNSSKPLQLLVDLLNDLICVYMYIVLPLFVLLVQLVYYVDCIIYIHYRSTSAADQLFTVLFTP